MELRELDIVPVTVVSENNSVDNNESVGGHTASISGGLTSECGVSASIKMELAWLSRAQRAIR